jgi:hypothetical protein
MSSINDRVQGIEKAITKQKSNISQKLARLDSSGHAYLTVWASILQSIVAKVDKLLEQGTFVFTIR